MTIKVATFRNLPSSKGTLKMAIALEHRPVRRAPSTRDAGSLSHIVREFVERIVSAWQRYRVEREQESMPFDLRKDIGYRSWDKTTR